MNRSLYSLLFHLLLPLIALRLLWRAWRAPAYARRIGERFAFGLPEVRAGGIWLHAVSVGESIAAAPLIRQLQKRYPDWPITVTCMTPTGSERIRALFGDSVAHCYLPYDLPWAARRFLRHLQPRLAVIMETELWPNHIHQCARLGVPVALANARLSERSARGYARFARLTAPMLAQMNLIAEQLLADAAELRQQWGAGQRPVWIAASTHAGEDEIILAAHRQILIQHPDALLILVPRHPERFASVYDLCQREGFATRRRSLNEAVAVDSAVLLGDTMGELLFLYALSDVAFVGGSLVPNGGHNLLEPAALGKPVLSGPQVFNFLEIAAQLRAEGALTEVADAASLAEAVLRLWLQPALAQQMSSAGARVMRRNQGALQRLLDGLGALLDKA